MLDVIFERPNTGSSAGIVCKVEMEKNIEPDIITMYIANGASVSNGSGITAYDAGVNYSHYRNGFIIRIIAAFTTGTNNRTHIKLFGKYNYDGIKIIESFDNRVEIRNENGVLITDNGRPWIDGTYPPDAKNRAGLTGLHAAPIASSNEFADLSGLNPNKEEEITEAERGAGVERALEGNEK